MLMRKINTPHTNWDLLGACNRSPGFQFDILKYIEHGGVTDNFESGPIISAEVSEQTILMWFLTKYA